MVDIVLQAPHEGQLRAWKSRGRFTALRCGRRWGKTALAESIAAQCSATGLPIGIFAPDYKILSETYRDLEHLLLPVTADSNKTEGIIRLTTGGRVDFWTLNNPRAGRSRKYGGVIIDEAAFADGDMEHVWQNAIAPTLLDYQGWAWAMSTPNGKDSKNWFYRICTDKSLGWTEFHAPTSDNPILDKDAVEKLRDLYPPLVYQQEYLADFVDWNGAAFFAESAFLEDGKPAVVPRRVDHVYAVVDTALKDGLEHDGTAVVYFAKDTAAGNRLWILDWEVLQIEGSLLDKWLPTVARRLEELAETHQARYGARGLWIEDKASGIVLLQQAARMGIEATGIPTNLTAMGKDGRALNASPHVHQGKVKITGYAYDKVLNYRGETCNHLLSQVCGFRIGAKTPHSMDLLDCTTYGISLGLGNSEGY